MWLQVGIPVTVLERSDTLREEGASINLATNAWRAMDVLGIGDTLRKRFCRIERYLPGQLQNTSLVNEATAP